MRLPGGERERERLTHVTTLLDEFVRGFGNAVADIRDKVVNEPWFGRSDTPTAERTPEPAATHPDLMGAFFEGREVSREEIGSPAPEHSHDLGYSR